MSPSGSARSWLWRRWSRRSEKRVRQPRRYGRREVLSFVLFRNMPLIHSPEGIKHGRHADPSEQINQQVCRVFTAHKKSSKSNYGWGGGCALVSSGSGSPAGGGAERSACAASWLCVWLLSWLAAALF